MMIWTRDFPKFLIGNKPLTLNELEPFITGQGDELGLSTEKFLGDGVVTGYGQVDGRTVYVYAQDFTVHGGTLSETQSHRICRVMDLAVRNGDTGRVLGGLRRNEVLGFLVGMGVTLELGPFSAAIAPVAMASSPTYVWKAP